MKRYIFLAISLSFLPCFAQSQSIGEILQLVDSCNVNLEVARAKTDEEKEATKMGTALDDPTVGFDYLWGNKGVMGKRKDVNVSQEFDLATVFGVRRRLAKSQQELLDFELLQQRMETRLQVLSLLINLTYYNQGVKLYEERLVQERQLANAYEKRLAAGDANKIETNRARLSLADVEADAAMFRAERDALLVELKYLCGANEVGYDGTDYTPILVTQQEQNAPTLSYYQRAAADRRITVADNELKVARAQSLPTISAGYMAELTDDEKWRGVTFGISIPLWANKNNIKRAKLQRKTAEWEEHETETQVNQLIETQHLRTDRLRTIAEKMQQKLAVASSADLLKKALDEGEISLIEYTLEIKDLFALKLKALEAEKDYQQSVLFLSFL